MNILDENVLSDQRELLRRWRIRVRQVGYDLFVKGVKDEGIIPLLHQGRRATFFTRDDDFYRRDWCHPRYCLVYLDVDEDERLDHVIRVRPGGLAF